MTGAVREDPAQGPAGAPFKPGDRFRWTSGNGQTVRTGTMIKWNPYPGRLLPAWPGQWLVEIDPLPKPKGARPLKAGNPWDGFRTWFRPDMPRLERVP